jgi:hypothetical protein
MAMNGEEFWGVLLFCISLLITSVSFLEVVNLCILGNLITEIKIFVQIIGLSLHIWMYNKIINGFGDQLACLYMPIIIKI